MILRDCGETTGAGKIYVDLVGACKDVLGADDPIAMEVARQSAEFWRLRERNESHRQRLVAAGDIKSGIWSSEPLKETQPELPEYRLSLFKR
jgi:hypothetical protein